MKRYSVVQYLLFVLLIIMLPAQRACADTDIVVFDFEADPRLEQPWAAPALTDYTIKLLRRAAGLKAMPREQLRRLATRWNKGRREPLSFETKDAIRQFLGAAALIEGRLAVSRNGFSFIGTLIDPDSGLVEDLSFDMDEFSLEAGRELLSERLFSALGVSADAPDWRKITGTQSEEAYEYYWRAVYLYEQDSPGKALVYAIESSRHDDGYVEPVLLAGRLQLEKAELNVAESSFAAAAELAPGDDRVFFWWGFADFLARKYSVAEQRLRKAAELDSLNPEYHHQLGLLYVKNFEYSKALDAFFTATGIDPSLAESWYEISAIYARMKRGGEAVEYARKAVEWGGRSMIVRLKNDLDFGWLADNPQFLYVLKSE